MYLNEKLTKELLNDYNVRRSFYIMLLASQIDDVIYDPIL